MSKPTETVTIRFKEEEVRKIIWSLEFITKVSAMCQKDWEIDNILADMNRILEQIKETKGEKKNSSYIQAENCDSCQE
jgi:hypothetical protein